MPMGGGTLYATDQSGELVTVPYYVEALSPSDVGADGQPARWVEGRWFILHHNDVTRGTYDYSVGNEDRYDIEGFTCNTQLSPENGDRYGGSAFYYNRNSYTINYYNGGEVAHTADYKFEADISGAGAYVPDRPNNIPADYSFAGWYKDPEGTEVYEFTGKTMPSEDIIVYAKWAPVTYTVSFELNGGTGNCPPQELEPGEQVQQPTDPSREGFRFGGWLTAEGTPYDFHQGVTRNMTLYAQWISEDSYTVTYTPGTGTGTVPIDSNKYALEAHAQVAAPTGLTPPLGQVFLGWLLQGTEQIVQPGDQIEITGNMVLVAQWGEVPGMTQVIYKLEGGNYNGNSADVVVEAAINEQLVVKEAPQRDGYKFTGWLIQGTEEIVQPGDTIQVDAENEENNVLIAQWEADSITLTITKKIKDGGTPEQSFIFTVVGTKGASMSIAMNPSDFVGGVCTVTISGLPADTYTVTEDESWSWKYKADQSEKLANSDNNYSVEFTNTRDNEHWLGGTDIVENVFKPVGGDSGTQVTPAANTDANVTPLPTAPKDPEEDQGDKNNNTEPDPGEEAMTQEGGESNV